MIKIVRVIVVGEGKIVGAVAISVEWLMRVGWLRTLVLDVIRLKYGRCVATRSVRLVKI